MMKLSTRSATSGEQSEALAALPDLSIAAVCELRATGTIGATAKWAPMFRPTVRDVLWLIRESERKILYNRQVWMTHNSHVS